MRAIPLLFLTTAVLPAQMAVRATQLHLMTGDLKPIVNGVVLCGADGKIVKVGLASEVVIPEGWPVHEAAVVIPGLVDARSTAGMSGILNWDSRDQEQFEHSAPLQPELRAVDAFNGRDPLVQWLREFGVTTIHTGHAPGELISGQTMVLKTNVASVTKKEDVLNGFAGVAATLGSGSLKGEGKSPGTRGKSVAMLRADLIKAKAYVEKVAKAEADKQPDRDLHLEAMGAVLRREVPLIVTADRHHDIAAALRLSVEFGFRLVIDSGADAWMMAEEIKKAGVPVILHPTMARAAGDRENLTFGAAAKLQEAGIPFALQSGYESYVPKTRVVLFEAGMAAAHGLAPEQALAACTIRAAELLGLKERIGSLEVGKDADLALYDGDPLETTSHCIKVIIDGKVVSEVKR
jgi:imidazolonepropionase-like amidohydrolase